MKVYFISGLAADRRVFKNIRLPEGYEPVYLDWITPLRNESLQAYALRLGEKINRSEEFILVGLSMGGMIAVEIANHYRVKKTIIISSVPSSTQLPFYFRIAARMYLQHLVSIRLVKIAAIAKRLFTTETKEDKELLKSIIRESDAAFIRWALNAILKWKNKSIPTDLVHIHGTSDEILLIRYTKPTHMINKAGHLLIMNRADDVNQILNTIFQAIRSESDEKM